MKPKKNIKSHKHNNLDLWSSSNKSIPANSTERLIRSFGKLSKGWHYGEGLPPSSKAIDTAICLNKDLIRKGLTNTEAFPGLNGNLIINLQFNEYYFEFDIYNNHSINLYCEIDDRKFSEEKNRDYNGITKTISNTIAKWTSSESCTSGTTQNKREDLSEPLSRTQGTDLEYLLFSKHVSHVAMWETSDTVTANT